MRERAFMVGHQSHPCVKIAEWKILQILNLKAEDALLSVVFMFMSMKMRLLTEIGRAHV